MNPKNKEIISLSLIEAILFSLTLILGIICALYLQKTLLIQKINLPPILLPQFIFYFFLATLFTFLIFRFLKRKVIKGKIYKIFFIIASFFGSLLFFESFFPEPIPLILIFLLIFWWMRGPIVLNQDLLMIFSLAGIGASIGLSLEPEMMVLILIILSIYDFIAVYKTKHMVKIAEEMIETGTILGLIFPFEVSGFFKNINEVKPGEGKFLILGGGDVAFPLIFSVSLLKFGILESFITAIFSLFGLFANFLLFIFQKERKTIPALPLISLFSIIGYFIVSML
jgi:presenilin-like A22 family membrane protease